MPNSSTEAADKESLTRLSGVEGERDDRWQFPKHLGGIEHRVISTNVQTSRHTEMKAARVMSQIDECNTIRAAAALLELIEAKPNVFTSTWESCVRRLTHVLGASVVRGFTILLHD